MEDTVEVAQGNCKPVNITVENGGNCTVNIEITNCYNNTYCYPEWLTLEAVKGIVAAFKG